VRGQIKLIRIFQSPTLMSILFVRTIKYHEVCHSNVQAKVHSEKYAEYFSKVKNIEELVSNNTVKFL